MFSSRQVSMTMVCASFTILILSFQTTEMLGREAFFLWVCLLFGSFSGSYSLLPTATAKCFGKEYLSMNYGLVFTSHVRVLWINVQGNVFLSRESVQFYGLNLLSRDINKQGSVCGSYRGRGSSVGRARDSW